MNFTFLIIVIIATIIIVITLLLFINTVLEVVGYVSSF